MKNKLHFVIIILLIILLGTVAAAVVKINSYDVDYNEKVTYSAQENKFQFSSGGSMNVVYGGKTYTYSDLSAVDFSQGNTKITKEPQIIFGPNGKITEAYFTTGRDGDYVLGNDALHLPSGARVVYKNGQARVQIPGTTISPPQPLDTSSPNSYMFYSENDQGIKMGEYLVKGGLGYENGNYFIQDQATLELADMVISNPNHIKTYINFDGKPNYAYKGTYISFDRMKGIFVVGSNVDAPSPAIMFKKDNAYGLKIEDNDYFAVRSSGSSAGAYFKIKKSVAGVVPEMENLNDFILDQDGRSFFMMNQNLYAHNGPLLKDFGDRVSSTSVASTLTGIFRTHSGIIDKTIGDQVLGFSNYNEYAVGVDKRFIRLKHYKNNPAFFTGISNTEAYNYDLTEKGFEHLTGIALVAEDSAGRTYLNKPENIRYLYDLLNSIPIQQTRMVKSIHFHTGFFGYYAITYSPEMSVHMTVGEGATSSGNWMSAGTWRHEMGHIVDFNGGRNNRFDSMWYGSGIDDHVIVSSYAQNGGERISEFIGDLAYEDANGIREILGNNWQNNKWYRAAFAVAWYNYGFTDQRISEIFSGVNLPYDKNSLYGYMREVGINIQ